MHFFMLQPLHQMNIKIRIQQKKYQTENKIGILPNHCYWPLKEVHRSTGSSDYATGLNCDGFEQVELMGLNWSVAWALLMNRSTSHLTGWLTIRSPGLSMGMVGFNCFQQVWFEQVEFQIGLFLDSLFCGLGIIWNNLKGDINFNFIENIIQIVIFYINILKLVVSVNLPLDGQSLLTICRCYLIYIF